MVFGETAVDRFLRTNDLLAMIRAHECQEAGLAQDFDDTVMPFESLGEHEILDGDDRPRKKLARATTVFSAPNYCNEHGNLGAVLLVAWDKACAVAYAARSDPKDFAAPPPASGGELTALTAAAVRDAQAVVMWMPTTIEGFLAAARDMQAPPGATPRKPRRRSSTGARRRSFDALSPDAKFVSKRFDAARRGNAVSELNPRVLGKVSREMAKARLRQLRRQKQPATPAKATAATRAPAPPLGFSDKELRAVKLIFLFFDRDGEELLSQEDFCVSAEAFGKKVSPQDVATFFKTFANGSTIGLEEWVLFAAKLKAASVYVPA